MTSKVQELATKITGLHNLQQGITDIKDRLDREINNVNMDHAESIPMQDLSNISFDLGQVIEHLRNSSLGSTQELTQIILTETVEPEIIIDEITENEEEIA